jgi:N-methylhydantoinase A
MMKAASPSFTLGIDVGGTFTDITLCDNRNHSTTAFKVLTNREAPEQGILSAIEKAGIGLSDLKLIVHGTTIATNAVLERRGSRVAIVTTEGFRDVVELGRTTRGVPHTLLNPYFRKPPPLVRRKDRHVVSERTEKDGEVTKTLDEPFLTELAQRLADEGVESVAVCFFNSYQNASNESRAVQIIREKIEFVCSSSEVLNQIREYDRFSTCAVNAFVMPVMARYIRKLVSTLSKSSYSGGFFTMASNGGLLSDDMAAKYPVRTILSGPAAGVAAASTNMTAVGIKNFVTFDMGGTSSDVALVNDGQWPLKHETIINSLVVRMPQLDIHTIGAGGGSVAWLDQGDGLMLGPESAGSTPGPACYGRGGSKATLTDANVVLGRLASGQVLGGTLSIDAKLARDAIGQLAERKGVSPEDMADGIVKLGVAKAAAAIYEVSVARGHDPREFTLVPFGGAGPLHACAVADELGIKHVCIPRNPGAFSSYGALCTALIKDRSTTVLQRLTPALLQNCVAIFAEFAAKLLEDYEREKVNVSTFQVERQFDIRYLGQAHEITISVPDDANVELVSQIFRERFQKEFGRLDNDREIEIVNVRLIGRVQLEKPRIDKYTPNKDRGGRGARRAIYIDGKFLECDLIDRDSIDTKDVISGPAIVEEMTATLYIPPGWKLSVGELGELHVVPSSVARTLSPSLMLAV